MTQISRLTNIYVSVELHERSNDPWPSLIA